MASTKVTQGYSMVWSAEATYQTGMVVVYNNELWEAARNAVRSTPSAGPDWTLVLAASGGGTPGGNPNEFQYNNAGVFGGSPELFYSSGTTPPMIVVDNLGTPTAAAAIISNVDSGTGTGTLLVSGDTLSGINALIVGDPANISLFRINGSETVPTKVLSGQVIGNLSFLGWEGGDGLGVGSLAIGASLQAKAAEDFTTGSPVTNLLFILSGAVLPNGNNTNDFGTDLARWKTGYFMTVDAGAFTATGAPGVSGSFTTADAKTVTVTNGIITAITP